MKVYVKLCTVKDTDLADIISLYEVFVVVDSFLMPCQANSTEASSDMI